MIIENFKSLSSVLNTSDISDIICQSDGLEISWEKFLGDVYKLYRKLTAETGPGKYLLYCKSSYQFTVSLFSVWQTGSVCVLPPNNSSEVLKKFNNYVNAIITDQDCDTDIMKLAPLQDGEGSYRSLDPLPDNKVLLELFTSGTTGERKCVRKTIANLNLELLDLCKVFGNVLENAKTFSTVSHQHIYGLLHKILLPVCTNRVFIDETYFYPEKLISDMSRGGPNNVLISGPAHLKLIPELVNLDGMSDYCRAIFSSGSMLDSESAQKISSKTCITPIEVLGSTETGGVAWRTQSTITENTKWTPFPSVEIKKHEDGFLQVKSPFIFLDETDEMWFTMGDVVDIFDDNRFYLHGRGDRIAKIGEKRVSLEEMEKIIKTFQNVASCRVFPFTRDDTGFKRTILACVVETCEPVSIDERKKITDKFKTQLLQHFAQILVPKYWRFVTKMPFDAQGKISMEELKKLFDRRLGNV